MLLSFKNVRKMSSCLIAYAIFFSLVFTLTPQNTLAKANPIKVVLNGDEIVFPIDPIIENGSVLVPFRKIFEHLGAEVHWRPDARTVTAQKEGSTIQLTIGSKIAIVNGIERELDVPARIINGHTVVPLSFLREPLGARILWEQWEQTVYIFSESHIAVEHSTNWQYSTIQHVPDNFQGYGWADSSHIIGSSLINDGPVKAVYVTDPNSSDLFLLAELLDRFVISPDGSTMAWAAQGEIWLRNTLDSDIKEDIIDFSFYDDMYPYLSPLFSPNGNQLLVGMVHEWDTNFFIVDLNSKEIEQLSIRLAGYFLNSAVGWLDEDRILFTTRASVDLEGQSEYGSGYRQDLAIYDLKEKTYNKFTSAADHIFLTPLLIMEEQKLLVLEEGREEQHSDRLWIYDVNDGSRQEVGISAIQALAHPDETTVALITDIQWDGWNHQYEIALWDRKTGSISPFLTITGNDLNWSWSPDGDKLLISRVVAELKNREHDVYTHINLSNIVYKQSH